VKLEEAPNEWHSWLTLLFPSYVRAAFAPHHEQFWQWAWEIEAKRRPRPFVAAWPRGGAKSASAELANVALGARGKRRYALYVCETQDQADDHIATIATSLERLDVERAVNKYGSSKGWRRNRVVTAPIKQPDGSFSLGFIVDALGMDTAARGVKIDEDRPDLITFDDIDAEHDTMKITEKKKKTLTTRILPAGTAYCALLVVQNIIIPHGIMARLANVAEEKADFLSDRIVSGPIPAVRNLQTRSEQDEHGAVRVVITGGEPSWTGQNLAVCQSDIDSWGWAAWDKEAQHNVGDNPNALWSRELIEATRVAVTPTLERVVVGVDPPGTTGRCGIVGAGRATLGGKRHGYTLGDWSTPHGAAPDVWAGEVVKAYNLLKADAVVVEINQGGAMVKHTIRQVRGGEGIPVVEVRATRDKRTRAEPIKTAMAEGREHHVGYLPTLEGYMCRWVEGEESPDPMDAKVWALWDLLVENIGTNRRTQSFSFGTS